MVTPPPPPTLGKQKAKAGDVFKGCLILIVLGIVFIFVVAYGCSKMNPSTEAPKAENASAGTSSDEKFQEAIKSTYKGLPITANQLFDAYEENEVSADDEYKGKKLLISGRVGSINKDFLDNVYLELPSQSNPFMGVHAEIAESQKSLAGVLRKGQKVTLNCTGAGRVLTDAMVQDCTF